MIMVGNCESCSGVGFDLHITGLPQKSAGIGHGLDYVFIPAWWSVMKSRAHHDFSISTDMAHNICLQSA